MHLTDLSLSCHSQQDNAKGFHWRKKPQQDLITRTSFTQEKKVKSSSTAVAVALNLEKSIKAKQL